MAYKPPTVRSLAEAEDVGAFFPNAARAAEVARDTGAYRQRNVNIGRRSIAALGSGTFGAVSLESLRTAGAPTVAAKRLLEYDPMSLMKEVAALRYLQGMPNVAQIIGVTDTRASGNAPTELPVILLAPAKGSLASFIKKPRTDPDFLYKQNMPAAAAAAGAGAGAGAANLLNRPLQHKSWSEIKNIALQILRGYHVLHSWGIVHRDTKPANMLVTSYGEVQITDFGMAEYQDIFLPPSTDGYTGTRPYSSPEMLLRKIVHHRDYFIVPFTNDLWKRHDAWGVGVTLFELLTGATLFLNTGSELDILNRMFYVKGTPQTEDAGIVHTLYNTLPATHWLKTHLYPDAPNGIRTRIYERAIVRSPDFDPASPDADSELKQFADIIVNLLEYNPERRFTIAQALESPLFGGPPTVPPRPVLPPPLDPEMYSRSQLNMRMYKILFSWMFEVASSARLRLSVTDAPFVIDRAINYTTQFCSYIYTTGRAKAAAYDITTARGYPKFLSRTSLQAVGSVAYYIASMLFQRDGSEDDFTLESVVTLSGGAYELPFVEKVLNMFMESGIPFYGRTQFDRLLEDDAELPTVSVAERARRIFFMGLLNSLCYFGVYELYTGNGPLLRERLRQFAKKAGMDSHTFYRQTSWAFLTDAGEYHNSLKPFIDQLTLLPTAAEAGDVRVVELLMRTQKVTEPLVTAARAGTLHPDIARLFLAEAAVGRRRHALQLMAPPSAAARRTRRASRMRRTRRNH